MLEIRELKVRDFVESDYATVKESDTLSSVHSKLKSNWGSAFIFDSAGKILGVLSETHIVSSNLDPEKTTVKTLLFRAPKVSLDDRLTRAARLMVESDLSELPVISENNEVVGKIGFGAVLKTFSEHAEKRILVRELCTKKPISVKETTRIGEAIHLMRENNFSHLPVMDEQQKPVGMLRIYNIIAKAFMPKERAQAGTFSTEKNRRLEQPVSNFMSYPPIVVLEAEKASSAVQKMLEKKATGAIVVDEKGKIAGILTKGDFLHYIAELEPKDEKIAFSFAKGHEIQNLDEIDISQVKELVARFEKKFLPYLKGNSVNIHIKKRKEKTKKVSMYKVNVKISSPEGFYSAHAQEYGLPNTVHAALKKIEIQMEKKKTISKKDKKFFHKNKYIG